MQLDELKQPPGTLALLADPSVMIVEDDQDVASTIRRFIERVGMKACWARNGAEALRLKESFQPDIVLVDLELPDVNGVSLISWLAAQRDCGIIVVSGRGDEVERVVGIELGADDYITKPVPMRELVARIRAVHRRAARPGTTPAPGPAAQNGHVALGAVRVDLKRRAAMRQNEAGAEEQVHLTTAEFVGAGGADRSRAEAGFAGKAVRHGAAPALPGGRSRRRSAHPQPASQAFRRRDRA